MVPTRYGSVVNWIGAGLTETRRLAIWRPVVADLTSGERPVESTNGAVDRQQESIAPATRLLKGEQTVADSE